MQNSIFIKSDMGAQSAWKGFSAQTLYIAHRLLLDKDGYEYYPEDLEDLIIKQHGTVIEAIQIKNISADLSLSSLASSSMFEKGEGFFARMCHLHTKDPMFSNVKVVHFGSLGPELQGVCEDDSDRKQAVIDKLVNSHKLSLEQANWFVNSISFEKVSINDMTQSIRMHVGEYVAAMPAPDLAQDLLIQYISSLSKSKGYTSLQAWKEELHRIGTRIAAIDGFYKEYHKSLVRLSDLERNNTTDELRAEFTQGISAHPAHIRANLDIHRAYWIDRIRNAIDTTGVALVKGVSGQGKSTLCYRFLINTYPEGCVFCVRKLSSEQQTLDLIAALDALGKHTPDLVIYIDVNPGEAYWAFLLHELQARALKIPVVVSIRDEEYNSTSLNGLSLQYTLVELELTMEEAASIYLMLTQLKPHPVYRDFDEAWQAFGGKGPLIEFVYLLTNNQTLTQRLHYQIDAMLQQSIADSWLELLQLVSYAGRLGCAVDITAVKQVISCPDMNAAVRRLRDEYLIRVTPDNMLEALHPVRAQIVFDEVCEQTGTSRNNIFVKAINCISSHNVRYFLLDYFTYTAFNLYDIQQLAQISFLDWTSYASVIRAMLWLDVKRYVDTNEAFIRSFTERHGKAWLCFMPLDPSGIEQVDSLIAEGMLDIIPNKKTFIAKIQEVKTSLSSLCIDYLATDTFITNSVYPQTLPHTDVERSSFGYALFWLSKRNTSVRLPFSQEEIADSCAVGELQPCADLISGLAEHTTLQASYHIARDKFVTRLIDEMRIINFSVSDQQVTCKFVPPIFDSDAKPDKTNDINHYWRMKMLDVLKKVYPHKEYIDIELVGVDILEDYSIKPMDFKLHIHKSKRPNGWVGEVNGWVKSRIDTCLRPSSWDEYVSDIDDIRESAIDAVQEIIRLIDDIYKKGRWTKERWNGIENRITAFHAHTFAENRLPSFTVDPYSLYSEGNVSRPEANYFTMHQMLSVEKYKAFRKHLQKVYASLENFFTQFQEVLVARVEKRPITSIKNPQLAMFNLFSAVKELPLFQNEYQKLFLPYSRLKNNFESQETETLLTLVNTWRHVLDNPPSGHAIAYDAKLLSRKGKDYSTTILDQVSDCFGGNLIVWGNIAYIICQHDDPSSFVLETEYLSIVHKLRGILHLATLPCSNRWYMETQSLSYSYLPTFQGVYLPVAYPIPYYKLLDTGEQHITDHIFPESISDEVYEHIHAVGSSNSWSKGLATVSALKMYLRHYSQIISFTCDSICENSFSSIIDDLIEKVKAAYSGLSDMEREINTLNTSTDAALLECLPYLHTFVSSYEELRSCMMSRDDADALISSLEFIAGVILVVQMRLYQATD